jgi:large subunit ribosomal protein L1
MKRSKRYQNTLSDFKRNHEYDLDEGVAMVKKLATAKFDESIDIAVRLGVDPRHADQVVRGTVTLPHGTGKSQRVLVLCDDSKTAEAKEAGAEYAGLEEYIKKIKDGWLDFDVVVATPNVMGEVGKLGRILGPRGLMPNPKVGTVTMDVGNAVKEIKAGKIDFRVDRYGIIHSPVGKASFSEEALKENIKTFVSTLLRLKPAAAKGRYLISVTVSPTMGPGVKLPVTSAVYQD